MISIEKLKKKNEDLNKKKEDMNPTNGLDKTKLNIFTELDSNRAEQEDCPI